MNTTICEISSSNCGQDKMVILWSRTGTAITCITGVVKSITRYIATVVQLLYLLKVTIVSDRHRTIIMAQKQAAQRFWEPLILWKRRARETEESPAQIIQTVVTNNPSEAHPYLPSSEALRQSIKRLRRSNLPTPLEDLTIPENLRELFWMDGVDNHSRRSEECYRRLFQDIIY